MPENFTLFQYKDYLSRDGDPIIKIRQTSDHLFFMLGSHIRLRWCLDIVTGP